MGCKPIPLHRPYLPPDAAARVQAAVESGWLGGDGPHTTEACRILEEILGGTNVFLTPSGTHALELAATVLDLRPGDEVIVPSFTFASTANAFAVHGATPVFVDIRPDTWNLDERLADGRDHRAHPSNRACALRRCRVQDGCHRQDRR